MGMARIFMFIRERCPERCRHCHYRRHYTSSALATLLDNGFKRGVCAWRRECAWKIKLSLSLIAYTGKRPHDAGRAWREFLALLTPMPLSTVGGRCSLASTGATLLGLRPRSARHMTVDEYSLALTRECPVRQRPSLSPCLEPPVPSPV